MRGVNDSVNRKKMAVSALVIVAVLLLVILGFKMLNRRQESLAADAKNKIFIVKGEEKKANKYDRADKLSYTDSVRYTKEDLDHLDEYGLCITRNEIYARHGRMFNDQEIQKYFDGQPWYVAEYSPGDFDDSCLNRIETANVELIAECELERGYN